MRAIAYCRVSTKEQTQNLSIPTQQRGCRSYCEQQGLTLVREFIEEGESAKTMQRTQLKELIAYCTANRGKVDVLVVYSISRLSRDQHDYAVIRSFLAGLGVTVRSVTEPVDDTSTGRMIGGLMSVLAQFDNDQKAERTARGMQEALNLGRWTFKAPLGYLNGNSRVGPSLLPDSDRAHLIRMAFEAVGNGQSRPEVLQQATAAGLRSWKNQPLTAQSFGALLRNPVYAGQVEVKKWRISRLGDFTAFSRGMSQTLWNFVGLP